MKLHIWPESEQNIRERNLYALLQNNKVELFNPQLSMHGFESQKQAEFEGVFNALANNIKERLTHIKNANPQNIKKVGWFGRFIGKDVEAQVDFELARLRLDKANDESIQLYERAKVIKEQMQDVVDSLINDVTEIELHIEIIQQFLEDVADQELKEHYINHKDRIQRKLENLLAMKLSLTMNVEQAKLSALSATQLLDRHNEVDNSVHQFKQFMAQYNSSSSTEALNLQSLEKAFNSIFGKKHN